MTPQISALSAARRHGYSVLAKKGRLKSHEGTGSHRDPTTCDLRGFPSREFHTQHCRVRDDADPVCSTADTESTYCSRGCVYRFLDSIRRVRSSHVDKG